MYTKHESARLRHQFWTTLGQYMSPIRSSEGTRVNWTNYKTGEKNVAFRMYADGNRAMIALELSHKDPVLRQLFFEQIRQYKRMLEGMVHEKWHWQVEAYDENGKPVSRIFTEIEEVSVFKKEDWVQLIAFFKSRLLGLDEFWSSIRYTFESLH